MDHIPEQGPHAIRVPYLNGGPWDNKDFCTYGARLAAPQNRLTLSHMERLQILQTWLFFGLLTEIMKLAGVEILQDDFIESDTALGRRITTIKLPSYLMRLLEFERQQTTGQVERCNKVMTFLQVATQTTEEAWRYVNKNDFNDANFVSEIGAPVLLSISMACLALENACTVIYKTTFVPNTGIVKSMVWAAFLKLAMQKQGWCESALTRLFRSGGHELLYVGYTYGPESTDQDHSGCSGGSCSHLEDHVDEDKYSFQHQTPGCDCGIVEVDRQKMESIISDGGIPVCRLGTIDNGNGEPPKEIIQVEAAGARRPYVAVSHVWAQGLGNPRQNGLPRCSLIFVQEAVAGIWARLSSLGLKVATDNPGGVNGFWMDTLCVPVHPTSKHLRKMAIVQMKEIYGGAESVLVLDSSLRHRKTFQTLTEGLLSIALSPWSRRLWTFQEAVLARRIHVLIKETQTFDLDDVFQQLVRLLSGKVAGYYPVNTQYFSSMFRTVLRMWQGFRPHRVLLHGSTLILPPVPQALVNTPVLDPSFSRQVKADSRYTNAILALLPLRSTSRSSDETICIATLLGLDVLSFLNTQCKTEEETCEQRIIQLLGSLSQIPKSLVLSAGPKLLSSGFRWAPRSFLQSAAGEEGTRVSGDENPAFIVASKGLVGVWSAFVLDQAFSTDAVANTAETLLLQPNNCGTGPVVVYNPPGGGYPFVKVQVPRESREENRAMLVVLSCEPILKHMATRVALVMVRGLDDIEALRATLGLATQLEPQTDSSAREAGEQEQGTGENKPIEVEFLRVMMALDASPEHIKTHLEKGEEIQGKILLGRQWMIT